MPPGRGEMIMGPNGTMIMATPPPRGPGGRGMVLGFSLALAILGTIAIASTTFIFCTKVVIENGERKRKFSFCHRCRKEKISDLNLQSQPGSVLVPHLRVGDDGLIYQVEPPANVHMLVPGDSPVRGLGDPEPNMPDNNLHFNLNDDSHKGHYPVLNNFNQYDLEGKRE